MQKEGFDGLSLREGLFFRNCFFNRRKNPGTAPFRAGVKCSGIFCVSLLKSGDAYSMTKTVVVTRLRFVSTLPKFETLAKLFRKINKNFSLFNCNFWAFSHLNTKPLL